jgi:hypothetical protein
MSDWHIGQRIVCIKQGPWSCFIWPFEAAAGPKYNEICVIRDIWSGFGGAWLAIAGHPGRYADCWFMPLPERTLDGLREIAASIKQPEAVE